MNPKLFYDEIVMVIDFLDSFKIPYYDIDS